MNTELQKIDTTTILELSEQLHLIALLTDCDLVIEDAFPESACALVKGLVGRTLTSIAPALKSEGARLEKIMCDSVDSWRVSDLQILDSQLVGIAILPRTDAPGLILIAQKFPDGATSKRVFQQQRDELALLQDRLAKQKAALRKASERMQSLDRERRALMTLIVQDIRSSLSVVAGYVEWLKTDLDAELGSERRAALEAVMQGAQRMHDLVDDVQMMEQIEKRLSHMELTSVSLDELVSSVVSMWRGIAEVRGIELKMLTNSRKLDVQGDTSLLEDALRTLLDGLIRNASEGVTLTLSIFPLDAWGVIRLENSSILLDQKHVQGVSYARRDNKIDLLDLTLVRMIVEGHGGQLYVQEEANQPYRVSLWLLQSTVKATNSGQGSEHTGSFESLQSAIDKESDSVLVIDHIVVGEGQIRINTGSRRVWVNEQAIRLTSNEYTLLCYLAKQADTVLEHEELMEVIWPDAEDATVDGLRVLIWRLRHKLAQHSDKQYLRSVRGFGYMLVS